MSREFARRRESARAHGTHMRFRTHMHIAMCVECECAFESRIAHFTTMQSRVGMRARVTHELETTGRRVGARGTRPRCATLVIPVGIVFQLQAMQSRWTNWRMDPIFGELRSRQGTRHETHFNLPVRQHRRQHRH